MISLVENIEKIEWKVQKLSQKMKLLKKENEQLIEENILLKNNLEKHKKNIANLEEQINKTKDVLKTTEKRDNNENPTLLKEEIDQYIKEIDNCLEWLQTM
jgi:regulator of replication initiation timing